MVYSLILSGKLHPAWNMAIDEALLHCAQERGAQELIVRFYDWDRPSISIGYFLKHSTARAMLARDTEVPFVVRRPTGGGMVRHGNDFTYSMIFPQAWVPPEYPGESGPYRFVHGQLRETLMGMDAFKDITPLRSQDGQRGKISDCFSQPSAFDLMLYGKKIAGAAQRRSKGWILHQGSVTLDPPLLQWRAKNIPRRFFACLTHAQHDTSPAIPRALVAEESQQAAQLFSSRYNSQTWNEKF